MSRLSNCSRIWKMKTPRMSTPISTSSAMPSRRPSACRRWPTWRRRTGRSPSREADHLRHRLGTRDHHQERQHHAGKRDAQRAARERQVESFGDRHRQVEWADDDDEDADQHRRRDVEQRLDVPADLQTVDHAVQQQQDEQHLEHEGDAGRDEEVRLVRDDADDQRRQHEHRALQREQRDQRQDAALRDHREREHQQHRAEQVDELGEVRSSDFRRPPQGVRLPLGGRERSELGGPSSWPEMQRACRSPRAGTRWRGTGDAEDAHLRSASEQRERHAPPIASFDQQHRQREQQRHRFAGLGHAPRGRRARAHAVQAKSWARRPFDQRQVAA